jgi:hypothetical protein
MQLHPAEGSELFLLFEDIDLAFNYIFLVELMVNMAAHWWREFWADGWNVFDFLVVFITFLSMGPLQQVPGFKTLRLFRAFRVLRLFARLRFAKRALNHPSKSLALPRKTLPTLRLSSPTYETTDACGAQLVAHAHQCAHGQPAARVQRHFYRYDCRGDLRGAGRVLLPRR